MLPRWISGSFPDWLNHPHSLLHLLCRMFENYFMLFRSSVNSLPIMEGSNIGNHFFFITRKLRVRFEVIFHYNKIDNMFCSYCLCKQEVSRISSSLEHEYSGETELIIHTDVNDTHIPVLYHGGPVNEAFRSQSMSSWAEQSPKQQEHPAPSQRRQGRETGTTRTPANNSIELLPAS